MSSYRFCRTDDVQLLVDALNRCWLPYFPDEPPVTAASFKWSIRHLQVWCSSCMVAFSGSDPIGVLIGAKRSSTTLIHKIAVHPDHRRQGHGRHMLTSLSSKLAILGPPRLVAEVPEALTAACALFGASGYVQESILTDYVLEGPALRERGDATRVEGFLIPVTVDDLAANGLLGENDPQTCWERSVETLMARKDDIEGYAVASDERIEAYLLYIKRAENLEIGKSGNREISDAGAMPDSQISRFPDFQILSLRSLIDDDGARVKQLVARLGTGTLRFPKVHSSEMSKALLESCGFRPVGGHLLFAARARSA